MRTAIYPGTFDPITNGHIDVIERSALLFDNIIVAVTTNPAKTTLFNIEERVYLIQKSIRNIKNVQIDSFNDLLVNYAIRKKADVIIRGLRATTDFEYEFQMALVNRKLSKKIITVFLMPHEKYTYLNSTIVKEVSGFHGDVSCFVPPEVEKKLKEKFNNHKLL